MSKAGRKLIQAAKEGLQFARGETDEAGFGVHVPAKIDVREIRKSLNMTQNEFALNFGFSVATLRKWEQNERAPEGPARAYLTVIKRNPAAVRDALTIA